MTKERKTSILALIIICIACLLAGCATKKKAMTETATEQETTKVEQVKDTAIMRKYSNVANFITCVFFHKTIASYGISVNIIYSR